MFYNNGRNNSGLNEAVAELKDPNELLGIYIADEVAHLSDEQIQEFCKPDGVGEQLVEAGIMRKKTLVRLSKKDDLERRTTMAAFQLAKDHNDALWTMLAKNRVKERELIGKILQKYGNKAQRTATIGQRTYLKQKLPVAFMRAAGENR